jgi:hypothetical protein
LQFKASPRQIVLETFEKTHHKKELEEEWLKQ